LTAACWEKFPGTSKGVLGAVISGKLNPELRLKVKKSDSSDVADVEPQP